MAKEGCDLNGNGYPYPYVLLTKDGTDLEDEKEYTVVICGFLKGMEDELNQQDTGIVGLDAAKEYLKNVKEVSSGTPEMTEAEISEFLKKREEELSSTHENLQFIAVNQEGYYYSDEGLQGVWYGSKDLQDADIKSFLTSDWITNENQMVFARKLQSQLVVDGSIITHFILIRSMEEMAPYFRSSAFSNQSTTYVVDSNGTKMFEDTAVEELSLRGRNLFYAMEDQIYPHAGTFNSCLKRTKKKTIMCTDVVIEENTYYMVLKKLDGYDWSMLMLVPTSDHYAQMCLRVADNGIGMSKEFRNSSHPLTKKIPILAMTAKAFSEDVQNAFNAGMNAHIVKPVDMKVLIKTVRNLQTGAGAAGTLN